MRFQPRENPDGYWQVVMSEIPQIDDKTIPCNGSYNVIQARILGFTYPDYLRYCRANHSGTIRGREGYSYCVYKEKSNCAAVCKILNDEWQKFISNVKGLSLS